MSTNPPDPPSSRGYSGDPQQRIDGLSAWLAELDRKVGIRTYAAAAAVVRGLAVAIVALVLTLQTQNDAVTQGELDALDARISGVERRARDAARDDVAELQSQINDLERRVSRLADDAEATDRKLDVIRDDINDLRNQISELSAGG